jgi:pimeloyl-ACP methyl ester carboxylesterase
VLSWRAMPQASANGIQIEYETFGERSGRPLLLIMGLAAQLIHWDEDLCRALAERGHFVIRFDNRDVGRSTILADLGAPDAMEALLKRLQGEKVEAPYTLADMAADCAGLLDALDLPSAHVVGASLGGMIGQVLALEFPARVRSLTCIMSSTGNPALPTATPEALTALMSPPVAEREGAIERSVRIFRTIGSPGFPFDEPRIRARAALAWERGFHPDGVTRQLVASLASEPRHEALAAMRCPALVIHGKQDPLIPVEGGIDIARAIPMADLIVLAGMGHDLPRAVWPRLVEEITSLTRRAEGAGAPGS